MKDDLKTQFMKMQGAGNDFIVIEHAKGLDYASLAKKACDRHMGIGADGVLVLDSSETCDHRMRIFNADGSEAEMCGNGIRCIAVYIKHKFAVVPEEFTIETLAGKISASVEGEVARVHLIDPVDFRPDINIKVADQKLTVHFINTGVPHTIVFVRELQEMDVEGLGRLIRNHHTFAPQGTNVDFVEKIKDGSSACARMSAALKVRLWPAARAVWPRRLWVISRAQVKMSL